MTKTRGEKWEKYVGWSGKIVGFHSVLDLVFHCVEISYKYVQVKKPSHVVIHDVQVNSSKISPSMRTVGTSIDLYFQCIEKPPSTLLTREAGKFKTSIFRATFFSWHPLKNFHGGKRRSRAVRVISKELPIEVPKNEGPFTSCGQKYQL